MHLIDKQNGFYGSVPIVSGTVPIAVGAALEAKKKKSKSDFCRLFRGWSFGRRSCS